jgi:hypothetical protein
MTDDYERMEPGRLAFNRGDYFLAHELWEEIWREVRDAGRRLYVQGLIQIAAGLHHLQERRSRPAAALLRKGLEKLSRGQADPPTHLSVDLLTAEVARLLVELDTLGTAAADFSQVRL